VAGGGNGMKIKDVVINLRPEETMRLTRILIDDDEKEALSFLKECIKPQLDEATRDH
jgi:hypothetical protein